MRRFTTLLSLTLLLAFADPALAVKVGVVIKPDNVVDYGFKVSVKQDDKGLMVWTIERDLSKARSFPADSELTIARGAGVTLYDDKGIAAQQVGQALA